MKTTINQLQRFTWWEQNQICQAVDHLALKVDLRYFLMEFYEKRYFSLVEDPLLVNIIQTDKNQKMRVFRASERVEKDTLISQ